MENIQESELPVSGSDLISTSKYGIDKSGGHPINKILSPTIIIFVANEVSYLIFKTIHFHHYTQGESFVLMVVGVEQKISKSYITKFLPDELIIFKTYYDP